MLEIAFISFKQDFTCQLSVLLDIYVSDGLFLVITLLKIFDVPNFTLSQFLLIKTLEKQKNPP